MQCRTVNAGLFVTRETLLRFPWSGPRSLTKPELLHTLSQMHCRTVNARLFVTRETLLRFPWSGPRSLTSVILLCVCVVLKERARGSLSARRDRRRRQTMTDDGLLLQYLTLQYYQAPGTRRYQLLLGITTLQVPYHSKSTLKWELQFAPGNSPALLPK